VKQRTLAILKPDCIEAKVTGKVLDRILGAGFQIAGMKLLRMDEETAGAFYAVHRERPFYRDLVNFMSSGQCIPMVLEKEDAVEDFRKLIGATDPAEAADATIRKEFASSKQNNIVHGSDSPENAEVEIGFFFSDAELISTG
jgi:nucleoside-diphosphate kinase